jgi:hypothetical protein
MQSVLFGPGILHRIHALLYQDGLRTHLPPMYAAMSRHLRPLYKDLYRLPRQHVYHTALRLIRRAEQCGREVLPHILG